MNKKVIIAISLLLSFPLKCFSKNLYTNFEYKVRLQVKSYEKIKKVFEEHQEKLTQKLIFIYDSEDKVFLKNKVFLRLRFKLNKKCNFKKLLKKGCKGDFDWNIKIKPMNLESLVGYYHNNPNFKCELNVTLSKEYSSCAIKETFKNSKFKLKNSPKIFSDLQLEFLLKNFNKISSKDWQKMKLIYSKPVITHEISSLFPNFDREIKLEYWKMSNGKEFLEASTKSLYYDQELLDKLSAFLLSHGAEINPYPESRLQFIEY